MHAGLQQFGRLAARQAGADRHAVAERFGQRHDVRLCIRVLPGKPLSGAAHAGLDLVQHHQPALFIADGADVRR